MLLGAEFGKLWELIITHKYRFVLIKDYEFSQYISKLTSENYLN